MQFSDVSRLSPRESQLTTSFPKEFAGKSEQFSRTSGVAIPGEKFSSDHISLLHRSSTEAILEIYMRLTFLMFHCDLNWKAGASGYANAVASEITLLCINRPRFRVVLVL